MLLIDPRIGSGELLPFFKPYDVAVEIHPLEYGDIMWCGNGPSGPELVGVERKRLSDLVSSMRSNRLSGHQLPGLLAMYEWVYVLVEGVWRAGVGGEVEMLCGRDWVPLRVGPRWVMFSEVDHYLATLEHKAGVSVHFTQDPKQTAAWLVSRYKWWNDKTWDKHGSHEAIYAPYEERQGRRRGSFVSKPVGPVEMVASQFPGVSKKAYEFGKKFSSVLGMVSAEEKVLAEVEGIGKKGAKRIHEWLRGKS